MRSVGLLAPLLLVGCAAKQPIARVDAPEELLRRTRAYALGGLWHSLTRYCVAQDGSVGDVTTTLVSGDPELDQLHRDAVSKWRYRPQRVDRGRCHVVETREDFGEDKSEGQPMSIEGKAVRELASLLPRPPSAEVAQILFDKGLFGWEFFTRTSFCVEPDGSVSGPRTLRRSGLEALDRLAQATVAAWKFEPLTVGGQPKRVCADVLFVFRVDR